MKHAVGMLVRLLAFALALPLLTAAAGSAWLGHAAPESRREAHVALAKRGPEWLSSDAGRALFASPGAWGSPLIFGGAFVVSLLLLGVALRPARRRLAAARPLPASSFGASGREVAPASGRELRRMQKRARDIAAAEGGRAAGDYLLSNGLRDEAAAIFSEAGAFDRVADIRHDQNRFAESAQLYEKAGRHAAAGAIFAQLEQFADAARCYLAAEKRSVAGEMFERAGIHLEAGRCYRDIGFHRHAASAFLQANAERDAVESLVAILAEEGHSMSGENEQRQRELRGIAKKAGKLLMKLERPGEAESVLVKAGLFAAAAKVAQSVGASERSAELYLRAGRGDLAAEALDRAGDVRGAARLRGEYLRQTGQDEAAVRYLVEAGEFNDAADLYRKLQHFAEAAECFSKVKDFSAAAEMFQAAERWEEASEAWESCEQFERAAGCAERSGDVGRQALLLERAGLWYAAGHAYAEQERVDDAIRMLQSVETDNAQFREACALLGGLFRSKGMHTLSIAKFEQAAGGEPVARANVENYYELARQLESREEFGRASEIFERILAFDYHYSDVSTRLERSKLAARRTTDLPTGGSLPRPAQGRYELLRELGRGGMGVVYLARDTVLEREVAYKVLPEELRTNPSALRNFLREAKAAAQLNHSHIVTVYDAGESEHGFFLAMEYVDGTTLKQILRSKGVLPANGVVYIVRQIADALAFAHAKKVVHRDIKTANIMWTTDKQVKVMDFGLAKLMEEVRNATTLVSGTPFYMSPEQTLGRNVDHRTDLYSLGVTAFELATGSLPFRKGNVPYHHVHTAPPAPRSLNAELPERLSALILRCMEKDPGRRYASATEILKELDQIAAGSASNS